MYDKHKNIKIDFQVVVDNKICIGFNTAKKRNEFIKKLNGTRKVTSIANVQYPWNLGDGVHNLMSPSNLAEKIGIDISRIIKAIKNGKLKTEKCFDETMIVEHYGHIEINRIHYCIDP